MRAKSVEAEQERAVLRVKPGGRELESRPRSSGRGRRRAAWGDPKDHLTAGNARLRWFLINRAMYTNIKRQAVAIGSRKRIKAVHFGEHGDR